MKIGDFIGKTVISAETKRRYTICSITSPYIAVKSEKPDGNGLYSHYRFDCISGDPISNGSLIFEDKALTEPFKKAYGEYCRTRDAYYEDIGFWMKKD